MYDIFTKEDREDGLVPYGRQTGRPPGQQAAQVADVGQDRLMDRLVHPVPVTRGHEAHKVRAWAGTITVRRVT